MKIVMASRIFTPEPAAASFRLAALARELADRGHSVEVVTSRLPKGVTGDDPPGVRVRRARVLRDRTGAVRGYLPYLSFDLPLFVRLLCSARRADLYIVEPPPTTGLAASVATALLRRPMVYYAADILADAAASAGSPRAVVWVVRWMERIVWRCARRILSVSPSVTARLTELGVHPARIDEVGNGADTRVFMANGPAEKLETAFALYAGTASEVHGADVFVDAIAHVQGLRLVFLGGGSQIERLRRRADGVAPGRVEFRPTVAATEVAAWLRGAAVALASVKPEGAYQFAFPTKMYAAAACGTPLLFSGPARGPGVEFVHSAPAGVAVAHDFVDVAAALRQIVDRPEPDEVRAAQAEWAHRDFSMSAVACRSADAVETVRAAASPHPHF